ncbi:MAG: hypothetical protein L0228_03770 [Planctomycetes bacterium]|nr:hypothetical protein [Planctomycetota bacterium]
MPRILLTLASLSLILLLAAATIGFAMGDLYAQPRTSQTQTLMRWHFLTGLVAALAVVLVESVIVTYFIGTSRWCKEVIETYRLDSAAVQASNRLKRRTFPWALAGMLAVIGIIALGGASDPATGPNTKAWADWHLGGALGGTAFIAWTYFAAWNNVLTNQRIINQLVAEVASIRRERALDHPVGAS